MDMYQEKQPMTTPRARIETALTGGRNDQIPFSMYEGKLFQCAAERQLRNEGLCIINRLVPAVKTTSPNVEMTSRTYRDGGRTLTRTEYSTPVGSVFTIDEPAGFTTWHHKRMFSGPEDYKVLKFMIDDQQFAPNYDACFKAMADDGGDSIFRGNIGAEPLQLLISSWMGAEEFCMEWYDRQDEILTLYESIVAKRREIYPLLAKSPYLCFNYGGNVTPEIIGLDRFEKYYVPHYNEAAEVIGAAGKLVGCHFDANCKVLAQAIADTKLHYIEAFTPAPDTDMTLAEARAAWGDKTLWINFPSSVHLDGPEKVAKVTDDLLDQIDPFEGFIMSITEDIPEHLWRDNMLAMSKTMLARSGK